MSKWTVSAFLAGLAMATMAFVGGALVGGSDHAQAAEKAERHPAIHKAIHELREAREYMHKADHDFGGHKAKAIVACDEAIVQLEKALNFDRK